jgi:hypothetical protein
VQRLLDGASRRSSGVQFPHPDWEAPLLLRTEVVSACRLELLAVKDAPQDARQPISVAALQEQKAFLTDPGISPLFGGDPLAARRAAEQLQYSFTGHPEP